MQSLSQILHRCLVVFLSWDLTVIELGAPRNFRRQISACLIVRCWVPVVLSGCRVGVVYDTTTLRNVNVYTYVYIYMYICIYMMSERMNECICMYIHIHACTYTHGVERQRYSMHIHAYIHAYIHACMHACMHAYIHAHTHFLYRCVCMCVYIYTPILCTRIFTSTTSYVKHTCLLCVHDLHNSGVKCSKGLEAAFDVDCSARLPSRAVSPSNAIFGPKSGT